MRLCIYSVLKSLHARLVRTNPTCRRHRSGYVVRRRSQLGLKARALVLPRVALALELGHAALCGVSPCHGGRELLKQLGALAVSCAGFAFGSRTLFLDGGLRGLYASLRGTECTSKRLPVGCFLPLPRDRRGTQST